LPKKCLPPGLPDLCEEGVLDREGELRAVADNGIVHFEVLKILLGDLGIWVIDKLGHQALVQRRAELLEEEPV